MSNSLDTLEAQALQLSALERSQLLNSLLGSLEADEAIHAAWIKEAEIRDVEANQYPSPFVSGEEVLAKLRARL